MRESGVAFSHWIFLGIIVALVWILGAEVAGSNTFDRAFITELSEPKKGDVGFITEDTHLCHVDSITEYVVTDLERWVVLIARLDAAGGAIFLSEEDNKLGEWLAQWCSTLTEGYPVVIVRTKGDYALAVWHESLHFGDYTFIIRLSDFQAGGLRL